MRYPDPCLYLSYPTNRMHDSPAFCCPLSAFLQASSDSLKSFISFADFQAIMGPTDFQTKLHLPL